MFTKFSICGNIQLLPALLMLFVLEVILGCLSQPLHHIAVCIVHVHFTFVVQPRGFFPVSALHGFLQTQCQRCLVIGMRTSGYLGGADFGRA